MKDKIALITGCTGMDGSHLADQLLERGMIVYGIVRRQSTFSTSRINHLLDNNRFHLYYGDVTDAPNVYNIMMDIKPDYVFFLAAQSHVRISFDMPSYTSNVLINGCVNFLEAIRKYSPNTKFYNAGSSEMFGKVLQTPQNELTPFNPVSPYGSAKVFTYFLTRTYRISYGIFAANGILFNHEGPRRSENFVTRKITRAATRIKVGIQDILELGNLDAKRDWGYAPEYTQAMQLILDHSEPDDFVIATGETHSVREFVNLVFSKLDLDPSEYVMINPKYFRPTEVDLLLGDASKAAKILNWKAQNKFSNLVDIMIEHDMKLAEMEKKIGRKIMDY